MNPIDIVPIVGVFAIMYFLMIRPQIRERQEHEKLVTSLTRGDRVITASGMHGTIANVSGDTVLLEVSDKTRIVVDKTSISRRAPGSDPAPAP